MIYNYTQLHFLCCHSHPIYYLIRLWNGMVAVLHSPIHRIFPAQSEVRMAYFYALDFI